MRSVVSRCKLVMLLTFRDKIDSQNGEIERLKAVLDSKIQNEEKHTELIKQLNTAVTSYQSEISKLKSDAEDALERQKRAESAVDNSYKLVTCMLPRRIYKMFSRVIYVCLFVVSLPI